MVSKRSNESIEDYKKRRYEYDLKRRPDLTKLTIKWRERVKNNPEYKRKNSNRSKINYRRNKCITLEHYGGKCKCCGEEFLSFLTIDHIKGGGRKHIKENKITDIYKWLITNNFPKGFQVLCYNCNCGKREKSECPHNIFM